MRTTFSRYHALLACTVLIGFTGQAMAQVVPDSQFGTASPGRAEKDQLNLPEAKTETLPNIEVKEAAIEGAPAGAENINFTLKDLSLDGVTVYNPGELQAVYKDKLGQTISLADLYGIAADLTRKYRNDGYILTQIIVPPQTIETGTARLQVIEGYVANVSVQSEKQDSSLDLIRSYASRIKSDGGAVNVKNLEHWMLLINDLPGVQARGVLTPSPSATGAADMVIIVDRKVFDAVVSLDNYGSRYLGPTQATAAASLNSVLGLNEKITAQFVTTPMGGVNPELAYGGLDYEQPISTWGTVLKVFGSRIYTDPGFDLEQFEVKGQSDLLGATISQPIVRSRSFSVNTHATFDYRNVETTNNIEPKREDNIRALRVGAGADLLDTLLGVAHTSANFEVAQGLDVFGASEDGDNTSRPDGDPDFTKLTADIQRLQRITSRVNLLMGVQGQISNNPLYSTEEFGVGGAGLGRGYDPSEITGDEGVSGKVEVQWNEPVALDTDFIENYQLFGFYDIGKVWNDDATTSTQKVNSLASAGVGLRLELPQAINAGATLAFPLTRDVQTEDDKDTRLLFSVSKRF